MSSETDRKMKICHVITRMIVGGAQENTLLTIKGHVEKGHDCVLVTGFSPGREGELLKNVDLPEFRIETFPDLVRELSPIKDYMAYRRLKKFLRQEKFDVVHTHSSKAGIIGRLAAQEAAKSLPWGAVWNELLARADMPDDFQVMGSIRDYEKRVLAHR